MIFYHSLRVNFSRKTQMAGEIDINIACPQIYEIPRRRITENKPFSIDKQHMVFFFIENDYIIYKFIFVITAPGHLQLEVC